MMHGRLAGRALMGGRGILRLVPLPYLSKNVRMQMLISFV